MQIDYLEKARRVIDIEVGELQRMSARLDDTFNRVVDLLRERLDDRGKVVVCGVGKSGCIGVKIAATLTSTGCPAVVLDAVNAMHGDLGVVAEGDVFIAISYSGETEELFSILPAVRRLGVTVVALTGKRGSTLAQNSDLVLDVGVEREACPLDLAPTSSTTVMLALGDALAMVLLEARGFSREDFAKYHPGGKIGRTLFLKVRDIMRGVDEMAIVTPEMLVHEVLAEMTRFKSGAAVALDTQGSLAGIFTHGDFARLFQNVPDIAGRAVGEFLTREPVAIDSERLAVDALLLLEKHRVDEIVALDPERRPVGVVDSQDLARWRLV